MMVNIHIYIYTYIYKDSQWDYMGFTFTCPHMYGGPLGIHELNGVFIDGKIN